MIILCIYFFNSSVDKYAPNTPDLTIKLILLFIFFLIIMCLISHFLELKKVTTDDDVMKNIDPNSIV